MKTGRSQIIEFKRMLLKYELSIEDLEYIKDLQSDVNADFSSAIAALKRPDLFDNEKVEVMAEQSKEEEEVDNDRDPLFKKLFRKIVVLAHPDKHTEDMKASERALKQSMYERAVKANDDYNWAELITVAIKLDIELSEDYHPYVNDLRTEVDKVHKQIDAIESSIAWKWYHSDEVKREVILQAYVSHMEKVINGPKRETKLILGVGHPRTGTGFTSKALKAWGLDVGHEVQGKDGIVAWQLAVDKGPWPFIKEDPKQWNYKYTIYNVRNPRTAIPSIVYTENVEDASLDFRIQAGVLRSGNSVEQAIWSILKWDALIGAMNPSLTYRIEDESEKLYNFLKTNGVQLQDYVNPGIVNSRQHKDWESLAVAAKGVRPSLRIKINAYCEKYGYERLFT